MNRLEVLAVVFLVTLPFGFYRAHTRKFSVRWFLAIHLPVPLVFLARFESHLPYTFIPFTCAAFFAGQYLGGLAGRWWMRQRVRRRTGGYPAVGGSGRRSVGTGAQWLTGPAPGGDRRRPATEKTTKEEAP